MAGGLCLMNEVHVVFLDYGLCDTIVYYTVLRYVIRNCINEVVRWRHS